MYRTTLKFHSYCISNASLQVFFFLFRDLEEALSMGMDWSLREGVYVINFNILHIAYSGTPLVSGQ